MWDRTNAPARVLRSVTVQRASNECCGTGQQHEVACKKIAHRCKDRCRES
jgi:hypothetical protein